MCIYVYICIHILIQKICVNADNIGSRVTRKLYLFAHGAAVMYIYIHLHLHICIYIYWYVYVYIYWYQNMHTCRQYRFARHTKARLIRSWSSTYLYIFTHLHLHIYILICVYINTLIQKICIHADNIGSRGTGKLDLFAHGAAHIHIYSHICIYIYVYVYTDIHVYIHILTQRNLYKCRQYQFASHTNALPIRSCSSTYSYVNIFTSTSMYMYILTCIYTYIFTQNMCSCR